MLKINTVTMEKQIKQILKNSYDKSGDFNEQKAIKELLNLFIVSGRSEQLCRTFFPDGKTTSATKCQFCGKEKWEH